MTDLSGEHAVVTGGGSGIGLAVTRALLKQGAAVTVLDRAPAALEEASRVGAAAELADVADAEAIEALAARLAPADILVTCAGVLQSTLPPEELSWREWDRIVAVHQRGTYACCRSFGGRMAARGHGAIITISSVAGIGTGPLHSYGPAKAAIAHMSKCLAAEWGPRGVRVNSVAPGFTETPALDRGVAAGQLGLDRLRKGAALGRLVSAEEVANVVVFLASPAASAVTGVVLPVDAGYLVAGDWRVYGGLR